MAKQQLNVKEQHYADSLKEAEAIVTEAKEDMYLTMHKITEKHNKYGQYFLVDLAFNYNTPKEIMESAPPKDAEEEHSEPHEGVPYIVENDGTVTVPEGQLSMDELNQDPEDDE
ncbi:organic solvent tolerance protein OstA [Rummeliibacillus suwonensis]|uniref:organic solvent tolerance protein OstA n=1 Tax=Rummeliibacillus suwonensis TaxID=1306154 RepID=UPI00289F25D3|nr:organic solvent tolerance protein OstA [Rummeliibacillus suwonensis]